MGLSVAHRVRDAFRAGFVRRWHANPDLADTIDPVHGHAGRVARLVALLHPNPSAQVLIAALAHDDGEIVVGDLSAPFKRENPDIAIAADAMEARHPARIWGADPLANLEPFDRDLLKLCDRLDAYLWVQKHAQYIPAQPAWREARDWLLSEARRLELGPVVHDLIAAHAVDVRAEGLPFRVSPQAVSEGV
ncbi:MAG: YfbR-like 5'-deoxynucleotidase [Pseudomonadota bacterium]